MALAFNGELRRGQDVRSTNGMFLFQFPRLNIIIKHVLYHTILTPSAPHCPNM